MKIDAILVREILDSRGNATVEAEVSSGKYTAIAAAPSGASVGEHEVPSFPDGGASAAVSTFNSSFKSKLEGMEANYEEVDSFIKEQDPDRKKLGGNISIALSLAVAKLQAMLAEKEFYELFGDSHTLPFPLGNVIGGGIHAGKGSPELQEFLSIPFRAPTIKDAVFANSKVHKLALKKIYEKCPSFTRGRNDEGGWAPAIKNEKALEILASSCINASDELGFEIRPAMDAAVSCLWNPKDKKYHYKQGTKTTEEQISFIAELVDKYNVFYVEDALHENDFEGFAELNKQIGSKCLVCADDLTCTNPKLLQKAIDSGSANALIVKPNQIGSLSETEEVIKLAFSSEYTPTVSHRSGETTDASIAHLAVGFKIPIIKTGIVGGERIAKLNELIRIEERSGAGMAALNIS